MKRYSELVADALTRVGEIQPWDLAKLLAAGQQPMLLDVREPAEFAMLRLPDSINVPRGVLEQSCEWDFDETVPELASGRTREIVVICRSGYRSALVADVMQQMGFTQVVSLRSGVRGWNDFEQPQTSCSHQDCALSNANPKPSDSYCTVCWIWQRAAAYLRCTSNTSIGTGLPNRYPWKREQPFVSSMLRCASVSTPSAMTSRSNPCAIAIMVLTIA
jgi:rhodanese-related sulfurtransferase